MDDCPPIISDVLATCEVLHQSIDSLKDLAKITVEVEVSSPG